MIKRERLKENAYFSLEATLIMPFVFMAILFLIYTGFFFYDNCLLKQDTYRMLIRGSQIKYSSNEEVIQKIKEEDSKWYYDKYVMCVWGNKRIEVEHKSIFMEQEAALNVSIPFVSDLVGNNMWSLDTAVKAVRIHPTKTIRSCRKIESLLGKEKE